VGSFTNDGIDAKSDYREREYKKRMTSSGGSAGVVRTDESWGKAEVRASVVLNTLVHPLSVPSWKKRIRTSRSGFMLNARCVALKNKNKKTCIRRVSTHRRLRHNCQVHSTTKNAAKRKTRVWWVKKVMIRGVPAD
jgi:hypothetical protein